MTWDERFLALAAHVAQWSKDPRKKVGCVIARPDRTVASVGYNGFPRRVRDLAERLDDKPIKLAMVVHAEVNAVLSAYERLDECVAYVHPWQPCSSCAGILIQAGIHRVVAPAPTADQLKNWGESFRYGEMMLDEAMVTLDLV